MLRLLILDLFRGGFASSLQAWNIVLDRTIDQLEINAEIVVNQDISESTQSFPIHVRM